MTGPFRLRDLLEGVADVQGVTDVAASGAALDVEVSEVRDDSRKVAPGDLFVAIPGLAVDARRFIPDAAARGARALVVEGPPPSPSAFPGVVISVGSARRALGVIAANRFGAARALDLMAVTGTNGKTTTTYLLESMLLAAGKSAGVVGTVSIRAAAWTAGARTAWMTTPDALALHGLFAEMHAAGTSDVVLEATSQALEQGRLDGCRFQVAGLTNITQDHLDAHGTMERYFDAKAILFERLLRDGVGVGVFFVDQEEGQRMRARVRGGRSLGVAVTAEAGARAGRAADVIVHSAAQSPDGWRLRVATPVGELVIESPLVGGFNLSNLALAIGMAIGRGLDGDAIVGGLARLGGVPGRLERVANGRGVLCLVDYAHTPDALERAIAAVRPLTTGRVVVVFGCGGDRDRGKRPRMGQAAAAGSDIVVVTSDNPRSESPMAIIEEILPGVRQALTGDPRGALPPGRCLVIPDRKEAIRAALAQAQPDDCVVIAGKGHETYQILGDRTVPFDDGEVTRELLRSRARDDRGRAAR